MKKGYYFVFYLFSLVGIITFFTPIYIYPIFTIISGILIIRTLSKNNYIEKDNFFASTIIIIMMGIIGLSAISLSQYKKIAEYIKKREDINLTAYNPEYFKYVEEIPDKSIYINVKLNGKYGYINKSGETKIDFKYDYATPFYKIRAYDKTFELAAVSTKNTTDVIMKNERKVMSYNSEYANEDHEGKRDEFVKILKDVIGEKNPELEVSNKYNGFATRNIYEDAKNSNEKRYQFTDKYDVLASPYKYINEKSIMKLLLKNKETSEALIDYITYYTKDNITEIDDNFKNKSEYYDLVDKPIPLSESLNEILYNSLINFKALYIYENKEIENFNLDYCMNLLRSTEINEKANHCPHCGTPIPRKEDEPTLGRGIVTFIIIGTFSLVGFGFFYYGQHKNDPEYTQTAIEPDSNLAESNKAKFDTITKDTTSKDSLDNQEEEQAEKVFNSIRGRHQIRHKKSEQTSEDPDKDNDPSETTSSSLNETSTTPTASKPRIESIETE